MYIYSCLGYNQTYTNQAHAHTYTHQAHKHTKHMCTHTHTPIIIIFNNHQKNFAHRSCEPFLLILMEECYSQNAMTPQQMVCVNLWSFLTADQSTLCPASTHEAKFLYHRVDMFCFFLASTPFYMPSPGFLFGH